MEVFFEVGKGDRGSDNSLVITKEESYLKLIRRFQEE
jgi:hypothetical protein